MPFEEPLYETLSEPTYFPEISVINTNKPDFKLDSKFISEWNVASKKLVLVGELAPNSIEEKYVELLANDSSVVVLTEKTSNLHHPNFIDRIDTLITSFKEEDFKNFQPDILLTFGGMVVSKRIKAFLRNYKPKYHWHIDTLRAYDTYSALTHHFQTDCNGFFSQLQVENNGFSHYKNHIAPIWENRKAKHNKYVANIPFSDFKVFDFLSQHLPSNVQLQVSNSSPIRYIQLVDIDDSIEVFCNRGTSGIDGSTSTAIGASVINKKPTILITGDISFLYDSNALWNNYIPATFKIILINNNGGGIFRILPGHQENETFNTFFETSHHLTAEHLAKMYQFDYHTAKDENELENAWKSFVSNNTKPAILEVFTPEKLNNTILLDYFKSL